MRLMPPLRGGVLIVAGAFLYALCVIQDAAMAGHPLPVILSCVVATAALLAILRPRPGWTYLTAVASVALSLAFHLGAGPSTPPGFVELFCLLVLLADLWRRARGAGDYLAVVAVATAGVLLSVRWQNSDWFLFLVVTLGLGAILIGGILRRLEERRREAIVRTREEERVELSRELHDTVASHITGIIVTAQAAQLHTELDNVEPMLKGIEEAAQGALAATRQIVAEMRTAPSHMDAEPSSPVTQIMETIARFESTRSIHAVTFDLAAPLPPGRVSKVVHRIIQEALTNIQRYAPATEQVEIRVSRRRGDTVVTVSDHGGTDQEASVNGVVGSGMGILGLRERVEQLGGSFEAGPTAQGWQVKAILPEGGR